MDILIESTKNFEKDLAELNQDERVAVVEKVNNCTSLFTTRKVAVYRELYHPPLPSLANDYESSLYILRVSKELGVILTIDEDPIFEQIIFTLFRAVQHDDIDKAYNSIAEFLYQELLHQNRETVKVS